jgi:very-short-patch-repair endonuclease
MLPYKTTLKPFARNLRSNLTDPEKILWSRLRRKQMLGLQFYRQKPIAGYIVDFYCAEAKLVVELDGDSHYQEDAQAYDHIRDECMRSMGLQIMRFSNTDVIKNIDGVY